MIRRAWLRSWSRDAVEPRVRQLAVELVILLATAGALGVRFPA